MNASFVHWKLWGTDQVGYHYKTGEGPPAIPGEKAQACLTVGGRAA